MIKYFTATRLTSESAWSRLGPAFGSATRGRKAKNFAKEKQHLQENLNLELFIPIVSKRTRVVAPKMREAYKM